MITSDWNVDPARIDRNWQAITIELDAPRPGRIERTLRAFGLPAHLTRVVVATPGLRRAWFVAVALAIVAAMAPFEEDLTRDDLFSLLLLAPLVPVLGVSFSYGVEADPAHEASIATPMRGLRLILTRSAVVLSVSIVLLGIVGLLAPGSQPMAFAWLLPAIGLTSATLALMTFFAPRRAAGAAAGLWVIGVFTARAVANDRLAAFTALGQIVMVVMAIVAVLLVWFRRERFDRLDVLA